MHDIHVARLVRPHGGAFFHGLAGALLLAMISVAAGAQPVGPQRVGPTRLSLQQLFVTRVAPVPGEMDVAMSFDGQQVVVGVNALRGDVAGPGSTIYFSADGGRTFAPSAFNPSSRDPAVAFGPSSSFYHLSFVGNQAFSLAASANGGAAFNPLIQIGACANDAASAGAPAATSCGVDQPHMAVDPRPNAGGDRIYVVWRETDTFTLPGGAQQIVETPMIQCSPDGGATVLLPPQRIAQRIAPGGGLPQSDFLPRVAVGADGKVYAVFVDERRAATDEILLQRFSACDDPGGFRPEITGLGADQPARLVATFNNIRCDVATSAQGRPAGLDRCNDGNILSSPMVAIDAGSPRRIAVTYATNVTAERDEIRVAVSDDRGDTFRPEANYAIHGGTDGRRFLPWSCGANGLIFVGWYDRRNARADANDLTQYMARAFEIRRPTGAVVPTLRQFPELDVTQGVVDDHCASWPLAPRSTNDSESCSVGPRFAGVCAPPLPLPNVCNAGAPCPIGARCNVSGACVASCQNDAQCNGRPGDAAANPLVCEAGFCVPTSRLASVRCDFSDEIAGASTRCVAGEVCQTGGGATKYGDYNGMACTGLTAMVAWASHVPPPGVFEPIGIAVNVARLEASRQPLLDSLCTLNPDACVSVDRMLPGRIELLCDQPGCIVIDPIPENCRVKFGCPGCQEGGLCPPDYRLTLDDPGPDWSVDLTDGRGRPVAHRRSRQGGRLQIEFRPSKERFVPGAIGDFQLVFRMTPQGQAGKRYVVRMDLSAK